MKVDGSNNHEPPIVEVCIRARQADDETDCPLTLATGVINENDEFIDEVAYKPGEYFLNPGFLIIQLHNTDGDRRLEHSASAISQSINSIFANCGIGVTHLILRTLVELKHVIDGMRGELSHVVLVGHGGETGIQFADLSEPASGEDLGEVFNCLEGCNPIQIISLCCHTGCDEFSDQLSRASSVSDVIAPDGPFHTDWAVQFITGYMLEYFLNGQSVDKAVNNAIIQHEKTPMCVWRDGQKSCHSSQI